MSIWPRASSRLAAISPVVVFRQRSLNHSSCSWLPPGMKRDVNTWRNVGLSRAQATRARSIIARYAASPAGMLRLSAPWA